MSLDASFEQLKHPNPNMRDRAGLDIVEQRDETTIPKLMANLEAEDMIYRRASVKTLGMIGFDSVPYLVEALVNNDNSTIRASCAKALAQVAVIYPHDPFPQEGLEGLKKGMKDDNAVVHISSVMALGAIGIPALDILIEAVETTENLAVAVAVLNALGSIKDERCKEILTKIANDESVDTYVKESAVSALSRLEMITNYSR